MATVPLIVLELKTNLDNRGRATSTSTLDTINGLNAYVNPQPVAPGGQVKVTFTAAQGYTNVSFASGQLSSCQLDLVNSAKCSGNPMGDGMSCWWQWTCTASFTPGTYVGTFSSSEGNTRNVTITVGGTAPLPTSTGTAIQPTVTTINGLNGYVTPALVTPGGQVTLTFTSNDGLTNINLNSAGISNKSLCVSNPAATKCSGNTMGDGMSCWWQWTCPVVTTPGVYTATFSSGEGKNRDVSFTVGSGTVLPSPTMIQQPATGVQPTMVMTPIPTPTQVTSSTTGLVQFLMSFGGLVADGQCPVVAPVSVIVKSGNALAQYDQVTPERIGVVASAVIYRVTLPNVNLSTMTNAAIFVKGPKQIQTKYGKDGQSDYYGLAGGTLDLTSGTVFDFSHYPLMAGDANGDGVINGLDFSLVKSDVLTHRTVDSGANLATDLDGDCQATANDLNLLKLSLNDKQSQLY